MQSLVARYPTDASQIVVLRLAGLSFGKHGASLNLTRFILFWAVCASPIWLSYLPIPHLVPKGSHFLGYIVGLWAGLVLEVLAMATLFFNARNVGVIAGRLDAMISKRGYLAYESWQRRYGTTERQVPAIALFVVIAFAALLALKKLTVTTAIGSSLNPLTFPAFVIIGGMAGNGAHWLISGAILTRSLTKDDCLRLIWLAPGRTPGVESLARVYRIAFYFAAVGTSACLLPVILVTRGSTAGVGFVVKATLVAICAAIVLFVGIYPQYRLSLAIFNARQRSIQRLALKLPPLERAVDVPSSAAPALLKTVIDSPQGTVSDRTVAGLLSGLAITFIPLTIQIAFR